jgi:hypothetical protein
MEDFPSKDDAQASLKRATRSCYDACTRRLNHLSYLQLNLLVGSTRF